MDNKIAWIEFNIMNTKILLQKKIYTKSNINELKSDWTKKLEILYIQNNNIILLLYVLHKICKVIKNLL